MNLPNRLTLARVGMIPVFVALYLRADADIGGTGYLLALLVFVLASLTDLLDGYIARKRNLVTDFGKLMDPLADKLLVMSAMVCFAADGFAGPVTVIVILAREFLVTSIRLVAASKGVVVAADGWGKVKTVVQMLWICFGLLYLSAGISEPHLMWTTSSSYWPHEALKWSCIALEAGAVVLTVVSGFGYVWKNRRMFTDL